MLRTVMSMICITFIVFFLYGCASSQQGSSVIPPDEPRSVDDSDGGTLLLGSWQVVVDPVANNAEIIEFRTGNLILNVLQFLEPPALTGLTIANLSIDQVGKTVEVDVSINHSLPNAKFKIFDTRGVVYGPEITNTDGLTILTSPEYFKDVPLGYQDGLLGTSDDLVNYEGLAGFKYFCDGLGTNDDLVTFMSNPANVVNRGVFSEGPNSLTRHYVLDWNNVTYPFLAFNYSIYANWDKPAGDPPYELADFPIATANNQEAVCLTITEVENTLWYSGGIGGGNLSLQLEVWDWQGNIQDVSIDSGAVIPTMSGTPAGPGSTVYSHLFDFTDIPVTPDSAGSVEITILVTDPVTYDVAWIGGLLPDDNPMHGQSITSNFAHTTTVSSIAPPPIDMVIDYRPFAIDMASGLMNPDGTFNTTVGVQRIGLFLRNNGSVMVPGVQGSLSIDPVSGIVVIDPDYNFGDMEPGASVMGIFMAEFSMAVPGKYDFRVNLTAEGFADGVASRQAFVATFSQTGWSNFTATIPQGTVTANYLTFAWGPNLENIGAPTAFEWIVDHQEPFSGQFSELPFEDPWWKPFAAGFTAVMGLAYAADGIVEMCGGDLLSPGAEKVVVGAAVTGGVVIASDYKDFFRRGQENTLPDLTELTIQEVATATAIYDVPPVAQEPYTGHVDWEYTRITDGGSYSYSVVEPFFNLHYNTARDVQINQTVYTAGEELVVTASLMGEVDLYTNTDAYMVADISLKLSSQEELPLMLLIMFDDGTNGDVTADDGVYTAVQFIDEMFQPGTYTWDVFSQDVNHALATDAPLDAATNIGGMMIGHPLPNPPEPPDTCGLVNDGEFTVM